MLENGQYYLVTADDWFFAPDGESYRCVWGKCEIKNIEDVFGFTPIRPSTNWFLKIGKEDNHVIMAGCRIHYAVQCSKKPITRFDHVRAKDKETDIDYTALRIYCTE